MNLYSFPHCIKLSRTMITLLLINVACAGSPEKKQSVISSDSLFNRHGYELINPGGISVKSRFAVPQGYERICFPDSTFPEYLRSLTLKPHGSDVRLYNGRTKLRKVHAAVIDRDPGHKNLQQCADAVIRLRAEYLYDTEQYDAIHFSLTNGFRVEYSHWMQGNRVAVEGNKTWWVKSTEPGNTPLIFKQYLEFIYTYAGTLSLSNELKKIPLYEIQPGDIFIRGGSPGHAVIVIDAAINRETGEKVYMLAQSYMPAQDIHILKNPDEPDISPWYRADLSAKRLVTPEWTFDTTELMRFRED